MKRCSLYCKILHSRNNIMSSIVSGCGSCFLAELELTEIFCSEKKIASHNDEMQTGSKLLKYKKSSKRRSSGINKFAVLPLFILFVFFYRRLWFSSDAGGEGSSRFESAAETG